MQLASSSTTPSSLGRPPYPTLVSRGSNSTILTPAITASSVSPPPLSSSMALAQQLMPPLNELALDTTTGLGRAWATASCTTGSAAAPKITARLLRLMSFMRIPLPLAAARRPPPESEHQRCARDAKDLTLCHRRSGREKSDMGEFNPML